MYVTAGRLPDDPRSVDNTAPIPPVGPERTQCRRGGLQRGTAAGWPSNGTRSADNTALIPAVELDDTAPIPAVEPDDTAPIPAVEPDDAASSLVTETDDAASPPAVEPDNTQPRYGWLQRGTKWLFSAFFSLIAMAILALAIVLTLVPAITGGHTLTVVSGSMMPRLSVGAVVVNKPAEPSSLQAGDVITYAVGDDLVTHRIVEKTPGSDGPVFITKGDANDTVDDKPVQASQIRGKLWYAVPHIGTARDFLTSQTGLIIVSSAAVLITTVWFLIQLNRPIRTASKDS